MAASWRSKLPRPTTPQASAMAFCSFTSSPSRSRPVSRLLGTYPHDAQLDYFRIADDSSRTSSFTFHKPVYGRDGPSADCRLYWSLAAPHHTPIPPHSHA